MSSRWQATVSREKPNQDLGPYYLGAEKKAEKGCASGTSRAYGVPTREYVSHAWALLGLLRLQSQKLELST